MAEDSADIFVKFILDGSPIPGESNTQVSGDLFRGFYPTQMFEIDSFTFAVGIEDEDSHKHDDAAGQGRGGLGAAAGSVAGALGGGLGRAAVGGTNAALAGRHGGRPPQQSGGFKAFRSGKGGNVKYPVSVQPITITRPIDKSSPRLLQYCIDTTSFDSVSVVKRKAAGGPLAGQPYLRLDFVGVLIRDISWSNDEPIKEVTKLISRSITVRYRPQLPDGTLGAAKIGFWRLTGRRLGKPNAVTGAGQ